MSDHIPQSGPRLTPDDTARIIRMMPKDIKNLLMQGENFLAGGAIRSIIAGEAISDWDLFGSSVGDMRASANLMAAQRGGRLHTSPNAFTILAPPRIPVQFITRWLFSDVESLLQSFDYSISRSVIYFRPDPGVWESCCDPMFYRDLAAKRLRYMSPDRNEDAGGSMLRAQKFMHRGYHISPEDLGKVMARMTSRMEPNDLTTDEAGQARVLTGMLRHVDPLTVIDGFEMPEDEVGV